MRIERDQLIAGLPAREVRRFMRGAADQIIRIAVVTHFLGLSPAGARKFLKELERDGWIAAKVDHWEATEKGRALAMATAAKSLRRETAERLIADVVERARMINRDSSFAYRVRLLAVFGSALTGTERPNDVDIACKLAPRFAGEKQEILEDERRASRGSFINTLEWAAWPKLEVLKKLKSRSRGLSIQDFGISTLEGIDHKLVFSDDKGRHRAR
jgi:predicted nucleotidyltransferase